MCGRPRQFGIGLRRSTSADVWVEVPVKSNFSKLLATHRVAAGIGSDGAIRRQLPLHGAALVRNISDRDDKDVNMSIQMLNLSSKLKH